MDIGRIIKERREMKGLSQTEVSERSGVHRVALSKIERGVNIPSWDAALRLLNAVGLEVDFREIGDDRFR